MNANDFCRSLEPKYVTVGGVRTHYVECGSGPTVILLHGLSACFWNWWRNLPALAEHFHVVAYDLKGCGNSDKVRGRYTPEACVTQLTGLMNHLGIERAALIGHSMGGRVALTMALVAPERVQALVLVSPACYPTTGGRAVQFLILPGIGELYTRWLFSGRTEHLVRRALQFCMHPLATITEEDIFWNMRSGGDQKHKLAQVYLRYGRHMRFHRLWALAARYAEITTPTLIIGGDADRFVPVAHCEQLAQTLPNARAEIWTGTGHLAHSERPNRFNAEVIAFLQAQLQVKSMPHRAWLSWLMR